MPLDDDRNCELGYEGLDKRPGRCANAGCVSGIAAESGGYDVGSGALCGESVIDSGDIGTDGPAEFGMNATDNLGPGFGLGHTAVSTVESDDVGACVADGLCGLEIRSNVDVAVGVVDLGDADDGEIGLCPKGGDARNAFGTETTCSSAKNRSGHASKGIEVIERISRGCLAGDDELAAKGLEEGVGGAGLSYRHGRTFFVSRDKSSAIQYRTASTSCGTSRASHTHQRTLFLADRYISADQASPDQTKLRLYADSINDTNRIWCYGCHYSEPWI